VATDYKIIAGKAIKKFFCAIEKNMLDNGTARFYGCYEHILIKEIYSRPGRPLSITLKFG
jgi:hypothetical protein